MGSLFGGPAADADSARFFFARDDRARGPTAAGAPRLNASEGASQTLSMGRLFPDDESSARFEAERAPAPKLAAARPPGAGPQGSATLSMGRVYNPVSRGRAPRVH